MKPSYGAKKVSGRTPPEHILRRILQRVLLQRDIKRRNAATAFLFCIALLIAATVVPCAHADILLEKTELAVGEVQRITILPARETQTLLIITPIATYRYVGGIDEETAFIPDVPGRYTIRVLENNEAVEVATFTVTGGIAQPAAERLTLSSLIVQTGEPVLIDAPVVKLSDGVDAAAGTAYGVSCPHAVTVCSSRLPSAYVTQTR